VQRLFSTFANGWPGAGLLLLRGLTGIELLHYDILQIAEKPAPGALLPQLIATGAGIFLLVGLWTPVAGTLVAMLEVWMIFVVAGDPWVSIMLATLGAALAMIGPGAWSIDAQLFGRKRIETRQY
jgi:putative oxidoreductase